MSESGGGHRQAGSYLRPQPRPTAECHTILNSSAKPWQDSHPWSHVSVTGWASWSERPRHFETD